MSDKKETFVGKIGKVVSLREVITGLLLIVSLSGALYGSFKPEEEAELLTPIVENTNELSQENLNKIKEQEALLKLYKYQLASMKEKLDMIELINISLLKDRGGMTIDLDELYKLFEQKYQKKSRPNIKIDIKPGTKTYWK